jgi:hypothetical protein
MPLRQVEHCSIITDAKVDSITIAGLLADAVNQFKFTKRFQFQGFYSCFQGLKVIKQRIVMRELLSVKQTPMSLPAELILPPLLRVVVVAALKKASLAFCAFYQER